MRLSILLNFIILFCVISFYAYAIDTAPDSITNASVSAIPIASGASQTVSYKQYDKPWLMNPPPQELTQNEYDAGIFFQFISDNLPMVASSSYLPKLQPMVDEIASVTSRPDIKYRVKIVDDPECNAIILPTGVIYINSGLLKKIESDDELAGVLAHEIAHNIRFHMTQRLSENMPIIGSRIIGFIVKISGYATLNPTLVAIGSIADNTATAIMSEISIPQEDEADALGYEYLKKTHYSPVGMLLFLEKLAMFNGENEKESGIYQNHSLSIKRVAIVKKYLEQDGFNIVAEKRKIFKMPNAEVKEVKPGSGTVAYKIVYNKIEIITLGHTDENKIKAELLAVNINQILNNTGEAYQIKVRNNGATRDIYYKNILLYTLVYDNLAYNAANTLDILAQNVVQKLKQVINDDAIAINRIGI